MPEQYIKDFFAVLNKVEITLESLSLKQLDHQKQELDALRPLPRAALVSLEEKLRIEEVHNSTAIEGNSLTLGETALVLEKGLTVEGKPLKDHFEVVGYDEGLTFVKNIVQNKKDYPLSEALVQEVHRLAFKKMENFEKEWEHGIGLYRTAQVYISGSHHTPPAAHKVPALMKDFMKYLRAEEHDLHPVCLAALWHFGFTYIHPFSDGNGRVARLMMNLILLRGGYPLTIITLKKRAPYMAALEKASVEHDGAPFIDLIAQCVHEVLRLYFEAAQ